MEALAIDYAQLAVALSAALGAGLLRGTTGFGSALILAPVLAQVFDARDAVATSLMIGLTASIIMAPRHFHDVRVRVVATTGLAGVMCLVPGVFLLHVVEPDIMRRIIGWVTLVTAIVMLVFPRRDFPAGPVPQMAFGGIGGVLMGATSMGGPPVVLYLVGRPDRPDATKANIIYVVGALEGASLLMLAITGVVSFRSLLTFGLLLPAFAAGTIMGRQLYGHVGDRYRLVVLVVLLCIGVVAAVR